MRVVVLLLDAMKRPPLAAAAAAVVDVLCRATSPTSSMPVAVTFSMGVSTRSPGIQVCDVMYRYGLFTFNAEEKAVALWRDSCAY